MVQSAGLLRARVIGNQELAPGAFLLRIDRHRPFVPGQNMALTVDPGLPPRSYSIASGTGDPFTEVLFDVVPGGTLTPRLAGLKAGDSLFVSEPFGSFQDDRRPAWWIAGGTGVAPFRSMVRSGSGEGKVLIHGSRRLDRLYFRDFLASRFGACREGAYRPCCRTQPAEGVYPGRLTELIGALEPPPDGRYLLCGSAEMVVAVRDALIAKGVSFLRIIAEIFF
jgi:ferredoxin--NADP+ reductase